MRKDAASSMTWKIWKVENGQCMWYKHPSGNLTLPTEIE
jgi:hypothetical protein